MYQNEIKVTSLYTQNKSFAGSSLPAETKALRTDRLTVGPTDRRRDRPTDGRTHPLIESRLTTNNRLQRSQDSMETRRKRCFDGLYNIIPFLYQA